MNKKFYEPKYIVLSGVFLFIFGILMPYILPNSEGLVRGLVIGIGLGTISSNLFRLFNINE